MTDVAIGAGLNLVADAAATTIKVPLPRGAGHVRPLAEPFAVAPVRAPVPAASAAVPAPVPARVARPTRPRTDRTTAAFDVLIAITGAAGAVATGTLSIGLALTVAAGWPLALVAAGHYRRRTLGETGTRRMRLVLGAGARAAVIALAIAPLFAGADVVALVALVATLSVASAVPPLLGAGRRPQRLVLAGRGRDVREALIELEATGRHEVVAACLTRDTKLQLGGIPTYIGFKDSSSVAHDHQADALVVLPGARLTPHEVRRLHWSLAATGAELYLGTGLRDVEPQRTRVVSSAGLDVLHVSRPVLGGPRRLVKDVVERTLALLAFLTALPVLAALCLAIRLETPGPALFRQERIGRHGVPFTMLKLRSMSVAAEAERTGLANELDGVLFKIQRDPRITPLGRVLRRYSLDELPQLWNVVRGDMSLVGPRPALPGEVARYDVDPRRRLVVKPGVTGLWQVSGRSDLSWEESVRLDLKYVENWSLGLDLRILGRTGRAVLGHRGAY